MSLTLIPLNQLQIQEGRNWIEFHEIPSLGTGLAIQWKMEYLWESSIVFGQINLGNVVILFVSSNDFNRSNSKIVFKPDIIDDIKAPIGKNRIPNDAIHDAWIGVIVIISFWLWSFETPLRAKIRIVGNARKRPLKFGQNCISSRTLDMCIFYNCKSRHIYHIERKAILYCCCQNLWNSKHGRKNSNKFQFILTHLSEISPKTAWFLLTTHLNLLFRNTEGENLFIGLN